MRKQEEGRKRVRKLERKGKIRREKRGGKGERKQ